MLELNTFEIKLVFGGIDPQICADDSEISLGNTTNGYKGGFYIGAIAGKSVYAIANSVKVVAITVKVGAVNFIYGIWSAVTNNSEPEINIDKKDRDL
jgi:hypothetical protein